MSATTKTTAKLGLIVGNRGFFPGHLAAEGRQDMLRVLGAAGVEVVALTPQDSKYGAVETFEGQVDGVLVFPSRGTAGFGYDPIFRPDGHDRTFGEMSAEEKHGIPADGSLALSHRARAFQKFARARL